MDIEYPIKKGTPGLILRQQDCPLAPLTRGLLGQLRQYGSRSGTTINNGSSPDNGENEAYYAFFFVNTIEKRLKHNAAFVTRNTYFFDAPQKCDHCSSRR